jgi:hypothetical protein
MGGETRFGGFFDVGSPMSLLGFFGSFIGGLFGEGGSFLSL